MTMLRPRVRPAPFGLIAIAVAVACAGGCGGDDSSTSATTTATTTATTNATTTATTSGMSSGMSSGMTSGTSGTSSANSTSTDESETAAETETETETETGGATSVEPVAPLWKVVLGPGGGQAVVVDPTGHAIVTGSSASPEGDDDIVVLKLASDGTVVWNRQIGAAGQELGTSVAVADDGDVFVGGKIGSAEVDFGGGIVVSGLQDGREYGFVARLDAATGDGEWVRIFRAAKDAPVFIDHIAARGGRVAIGGRYDDTLTYDFDDGSEEGTTAELAPLGTLRSSFFASIEASTGLAQWMIGVGAAGLSSVQADGVAIDSDGEVYGALTFGDDAILGLGEPRPRVGQAQDFVLARLSADAGAPVWVQQFADADADAFAFASRLSQSDDGPLRVSATLRGTIDFGLGPLSAPIDSRDAIFLAIDRTTGLALAQRQLGGPLSQEFGVSARAAGDDLLVTGSYDIELNSGVELEIEGLTLPDVAGGDGSWVVRYDPEGAATWVRAVAPVAMQETNNPSVRARDLVGLPAGPIVLTGWVFGAGDLGDGETITSAPGRSQMVVWAWPQ